MCSTATFLGNFITFFVHSKKEVATSQIHPNIWMTSFTFCQCQVFLTGNNNNHFNQGYYKNIRLFSDRDYRKIYEKNNICSLLSTVIQLFVTKRIHAVYAVIHRGYYMDAWRYQISLRVLKNISRLSAANEWNIFSTWEENFCISKWPCKVLFII